MKFYDSLGPNPRVVRIFMAEKGIEIPSEMVDVIAGENRQSAHLERNPHGQTPVLQTDDGTYISEITAICEYLEELHPEPALIGSTPAERAETRMWTRRIDLNIAEPLTNSYRYSGGIKLFAPRMVTLPEAADGLRRVGLDRLRWLNGQMADRTWIAGDRFTLADILLFCFVQFANDRGTPLEPEMNALADWMERVAARPSSNA